jgi:hypothetical protein
MTSKSDTFVRADNASLGANWTAWSWSGAAGLGITSNQVSSSAASTHGDYWSADAFGNDQSSEITVAVVPGSGDWVGVTVRQVTPGTGYLAIFFAGTFYIFNENGSTSPTVIVSTSGTLTAGDVMTLTAIGTSITLYKNGSQVLTTTNSTYTSGAPGIAIYGTTPRISAWDATDAFGPVVTVDTTTQANAAQNVKVRRWMQASGGTAPYSWSVVSGTLPTGLSLSSSGELSGTPTGTGASTFTVQATDSLSVSGTHSITLTVVAASFTPGSPSTDGNGVVTRTITSVLNMNSAETLRVLQPVSPSTAYRRALVIVNPVNSGTDDTTFGNALDTIRILGLHNSLNLTILEPSNGGNWLADNPSNANLVQETWMLQVAAWFRTNYGTGIEKLFLVGFSRSGLASLGLYLHHPEVYDGCAVWDFPGMMAAYDGTDPNGSVGGSPGSSYGTPENFTANYQLSAANLAKWKVGTDLGAVKRIHIGGANFFNADVPQIDGVLTTAGILHFYNFVTADAHNWHPSPDWLPTALTNLQTLSSKNTGMLSATWPA